MKTSWKRRMLFYGFPITLSLLLLLASCREKKQADHSEHGKTDTATVIYTCPMPEDSVFSDKPGTCPKCGMDLVKVEKGVTTVLPADSTAVYTCPMHPEIVQNQPGACPVCGMDLVKKKADSTDAAGITLDALLKPTNEVVIASLPLVGIRQSEEPVEIDVLGYTAYNTSAVGNISARVSGRIEKLYVKYRYQKVARGQRIMDIYSPELMTAQQNLLFLLKNDRENHSLIEAARQRLLLLGFSEQQLNQVLQSGVPALQVAVYSNYSGHIHEAGERSNMESDKTNGAMLSETQTTRELNLKEGMYVQKGQAVFSVYDPDRLWILLNIYPQDQAFVHTGDKVRIIPETKPDQDFRATVNYIEPFFRSGSKTVAARVNFDNRKLQLPVGSQVKATLFSGMIRANWLPKEAVLSLGMDKVVFLKTGEGFRVRKIGTGHAHKKWWQVTSGLGEKDSVAANAQYLVDSESFVKIKSE